MKKIPRFYKLFSRMGLKNPPINTTSLNIGVEDGPDAILTQRFLETVSPAQVEQFRFSDPREIPDNEFFNKLANDSLKAQRLIENTYKPGETQVVIGGDHSVAFPAINAVLARTESRFMGYVQIDSHIDMNRRDESISGNWHGMYLRPLLDGFDLDPINALVKQKLTHENVTFIGNLDSDPAEQKFFEDNKLFNITVSDLRKDRTNLENLIKKLSKMKHLHVSIDIDGFDKNIAPATGLPQQKGLLFEDAQPFFAFVKTFPSVSIDLVEVNPKKYGAKKTILLARRIILELLK